MRTMKREGWKLRKVVASVNGRHASSKKWLILIVVHEVVEPNRSLDRVGCWIDLSHSDNERAKVKHEISRAQAIRSDRQLTYCCSSEIRPESQLSGKTVRVTSHGDIAHKVECNAQLLIVRVACRRTSYD